MDYYYNSAEKTPEKPRINEFFNSSTDISIKK